MRGALRPGPVTGARGPPLSGCPSGSPCDQLAQPKGARPLPGALCTRAWRPNTGSYLDHLHLPNSHPFQLLEIVGREGVSLTTVLTTHHHWDHARGNTELARLLPGLVVLGADERICALTRRLAHGEELRFGAIHVRCLLTPGHTLGHMSYFLWEDECLDPPAVFSGDALSVAGCGSRLETTAQQMYHSLVETLGTLPPETKVFCGHEHTLGNLEFAQKVEPWNNHVKAKLSWAKKRDEDDVPTVPSTLGEELLYNPFLRVAEEPVRKFTGKVAPAEVLEVLCRERASFERAAEPLQPQARALLALQWGLLSMPRPK
ncbi:hydroxyacylglutathione hydrolase-like protein isoform X2 [Physeter macrocephalus]|uniref:Hydroxyacylglutathione hydrolase-like protein isoform X2 n=1 Tax=Physeter macrocephalus TaxID=9755 RepID=A0A455B743_PHYMC|nr:hydroxyacylglutathione hydrolase-like protein isoform X2 [Physeter catodon]|eukprot:XP_028339831.1 hydroxyacylglutathione hydrolase-like protein isoform X2 [Physeter catodon]